MNRRLQQFLDLEQLTSARFAEIMDIQRSGVSHLLSGRNKPGYDFINKFALKFPQINIEWLITGKGKPYKDQDNEPIPSEAPEKGTENLFDSSFLFGTSVPEPKETRKSAPDLPEIPQKSIRRITIFYSDGSFDEFYPNK